MAVLTGQFGTLATFTGTATGTDSVHGDSYLVLAVHYTTTGAAGGTIELQQSLDNGTNWVTVASSSQTPTNATSPLGGKAVIVSNPVGLYRAACTAHTNGTHTVTWRLGTRS